MLLMVFLCFLIPLFTLVLKSYRKVSIAKVNDLVHGQNTSGFATLWDL